jgi:hypothetical protein
MATLAEPMGSNHVAANHTKRPEVTSDPPSAGPNRTTKEGLSVFDEALQVAAEFCE